MIRKERTHGIRIPGTFITDQRSPTGAGQEVATWPNPSGNDFAVLSGATSYRKVHGFIRAHRNRLNKAFGFGWKSAPAYSAVRTILRGLDGGDVERIFRADAGHLGVVAIDGKALRHSFDAFNDQKAAHVLSAFSVDDALILGHLEVDEKSNEIPAAQGLIKALALEGRLYTMDAMHCQKNF